MKEEREEFAVDQYPEQKVFMYEEGKMHWYDKDRMKKERESLAGEVENPPGGGRQDMDNNQMHASDRNTLAGGHHSQGGGQNFDRSRHYSDGDGGELDPHRMIEDMIKNSDVQNDNSMEDSANTREESDDRKSHVESDSKSNVVKSSDDDRKTNPENFKSSFENAEDFRNTGVTAEDYRNTGVIAAAESALGNALFSVEQVESLLMAHEKKMFIAILCKLKDVKDDIGGILDDLTGAKSSMFGEDFIKSEEIKAEIQDDDFAAQDFIEVNYYDNGDQDYYKPKVKKNKIYKPKFKFGDLNCPHCDKTFTQESGLNRHIGKAHGKRPCGVCHQIFDSRLSLLKHARTEKHVTDDLKIVCGRDGCTQSFLSKSSLSRHVQFHHISKDPQKNSCETCYLEFENKKLLHEHMNEANHKKIICEICSLSFLKHHYLMEHIKNKHSQRYKCSDCGEVFDGKIDLNRHFKKEHHVDDRQWICQLCGHIAKTRNQLRNHQILHGEKKHTCEYCKKSFHTKPSLTKHIRSHTGEKPFDCHICGASFRSTSHRHRHMIIHTGRTPFVCNLCNKAFNQRGNLKTHMKSHMKGTLPIPGLKDD